MLHLLRRNPWPIDARFDRSFVLAYAWPAEGLRRLLPPGLELDEREGRGFLAVAFVITRGLRPAGLPEWAGQRFQFIGYRLFVRYRSRDGRRLRGLYILRSDTDSRAMVAAGNLLTHYQWHSGRIRLGETGNQTLLQATTEDGAADLRVRFTCDDDVPLPSGSCFPTWREARLFAGPMPFTFDYEKETHSMVIVEGVREHWEPLPVQAEVEEMAFLGHRRFADCGTPLLASAFAVRDIPYRWEAGVVEPL
jgi:hypothetical protein